MSFAEKHNKHNTNLTAQDSDWMLIGGDKEDINRPFSKELLFAEHNVSLALRKNIPSNKRKMEKPQQDRAAVFAISDEKIESAGTEHNQQSVLDEATQSAIARCNDVVTGYKTKQEYVTAGTTFMMVEYDPQEYTVDLRSIGDSCAFIVADDENQRHAVQISSTAHMIYQPIDCIMLAILRLRRYFEESLNEKERSAIIEIIRISFPAIDNDLLTNIDKLKNFIVDNYGSAIDPINSFLDSFKVSLADDHPCKNKALEPFLCYEDKKYYGRTNEMEKSLGGSYNLGYDGKPTVTFFIDDDENLKSELYGKVPQILKPFYHYQKNNFNSCAIIEKENHDAIPVINTSNITEYHEGKIYLSKFKAELVQQFGMNAEKLKLSLVVSSDGIMEKMTRQAIAEIVHGEHADKAAALVAACRNENERALWSKDDLSAIVLDDMQQGKGQRAYMLVCDGNGHYNQGNIMAQTAQDAVRDCLQKRFDLPALSSQKTPEQSSGAYSRR